MLGSEKANPNPLPERLESQYHNRHLAHQNFNKSVIDFVDLHKDRFSYINISQLISDGSEYNGTINHFQRKIYFQLAEKCIEVIQQKSGINLKTVNSNWIKIDLLVHRLMHFIKLNRKNPVYKPLKALYRKIKSI